ILWNGPGYVRHGGECLEGVFPGGGAKVFVGGERVDDPSAGIASPYMAVSTGGPVTVSTSRPMGLGEAEGVLKAAKEAMRESASAYGRLGEAAEAMRTCLAWDTIYEPEGGNVCSTVSRLWNANWGGYVLFCWDTYLSAMMAMPESKELAYSNLIAMTREKTGDGFVPNFGSAGGNKSLDRSQPPVGSLALKEVFRRYREPWVVELLFDDLLGWNRWYARRRRLPNGQMCWGSNPYPARTGRHWEREGVGASFGAALESGLDNSPMYDGVLFDPESSMMLLADVGLTGLYVMDCEALAELARAIGRPESGELAERAELAKDGLEMLWDEGSGMYLNRRVDTGEPSRRISPTNLYSFFSDRVTDGRARRMMDGYFYDESKFFGEYLLPSITRDDPAYKDQEYWRGRIWAPMNLLAYLAMRKKGLSDECRVLAERSENLLLKEWRLHGHVHENYHAETGMGCGVSSSDRFYHWGGLLALVALIDGGYVEGPERPL
ncbi:MAG: hypothetical protein FWE70_07895, partial [Oscillospiraceae bacterium]|nr:hypothetical protein [Oscillospiraceae bacterium]